MRPRALKQTCLAVAQTIIIAFCLSAPSAAQTPTPSPSPTTPSTGATFSDYLKNLAERAKALAPAIEAELEGPLLPWLENLSLTLAGLIMIAAFAKMWRENAGAGVDLFWWIARLGVIFALLGNGPNIVNGMSNTGQMIAGDGTILNQLCKEQRDKFETAYGKFNKAMFTVKEDPVNPDPRGVMGVINSKETELQGPDRKFQEISTSMPLLFDTMNISRSVISFGDLFLTILSKFLLIAMRLAAPVMIAVAIDRGIAQQVTYPYLWGVVVLTLIWPVVSLVIKSVAYLGANIGLAVGDGQQLFAVDSRTMEIINKGSEPVYTVFFAAAAMLIAGLSLWMSPYIAYQLSTGRLYEVASSTFSTVGNGIQYYAASLASSILQGAVTSQAAGPVSAPRSESPNARARSIVGFTGGANRILPPHRYFNLTTPAQRNLLGADQQPLSERGIKEIETYGAAGTQKWRGELELRY